MVAGTMRDGPKPVKLFCGLIARRGRSAEAERLLVQHFGKVDCESPEVAFDFTEYYRSEMGDDLVRKWLAFADLRQRGYLAAAKHAAAAIEDALREGGRRSVNIDPGYVDDAQVVLSTAKNYSHRIYIGAGCYAEVTLTYEHGEFKSLAWTYPDYRSAEALRFLRTAREIYAVQRRSVRP
jgi:hypothetical protein